MIIRYDQTVVTWMRQAASGRDGVETRSRDTRVVYSTRLLHIPNSRALDISCNGISVEFYVVKLLWTTVKVNIKEKDWSVSTKYSALLLSFANKFSLYGCNIAVAISSYLSYRKRKINQKSKYLTGRIIRAISRAQSRQAKLFS